MQRETWRKMSLNFAYQYLHHASRDLQHGANGFISPLKEVVLWIFIALKSPAVSWV
jgi:hypothetical protein